jgi:Lon protease-like protein
MPSHYLLEALPTKAKFHSMDNTKAINSICMVLPISKEEVKQANCNLQNPHTWHDIAKSIINDLNKSSYMDDTDNNNEEY